MGKIVATCLQCIKTMAGREEEEEEGEEEGGSEVEKVHPLR